MSATPWTMEQMTPDPAIRIGDTDTETLHLLPLRADELAYLRMLTGNEEGHGDITEHGADRRVYDKVRALAIVAGLVRHEAVPSEPHPRRRRP